MSGGLEIDQKTLDRFRDKQYWDEIQVTNFNEDNRKETWYVKLLTTSASGAPDEYGLLLTDQIRVWGRRCDAASIEAERKEYAPSMKKSTTAKLIALLEELLCRPNDHSHKEKAHQVTFEATTDSMTLQCSMAIEVYPFKWAFECLPIGSPAEQALLIRDQFIRPLQMMVAQCVGTKIRHKPAAEAKRAAASSGAAYDSFSLEYQFRGELDVLYKAAIERMHKAVDSGGGAASAGAAASAFSSFSLVMNSIESEEAAAAAAASQYSGAAAAAAVASSHAPAARRPPPAGRGGMDHKHSHAAVAAAAEPEPEPAAAAAAAPAMTEAEAELARREEVAKRIEAQKAAAATKKRKKFV